MKQKFGGLTERNVADLQASILGQRPFETTPPREETAGYIQQHLDSNFRLGANPLSHLRRLFNEHLWETLDLNPIFSRAFVENSDLALHGNATGVALAQIRDFARNADILWFAGCGELGVFFPFRYVVSTTRKKMSERREKLYGSSSLETHRTREEVLGHEVCSLLMRNGFVEITD